MTHIAGNIVRVLPPFSEAFPDQYVVREVSLAEGNQTIVYLVGVESAFAPEHLEVIE